ncbi:unnamed protein product, partial [Prorocentrum cordatum]
DGGTARVCLRVVGLGWISSVGVTIHPHRNLLRRSTSVPRGLPPSGEVTRRRWLPFSVEKPCRATRVVYIDNLEVVKIACKSAAATLRGTVPELVSEGRACYAAAGGGRYAFCWAAGFEFASSWRPLAASLVLARKRPASPRTGGRFSVSLVEDLLMCLALSGLCVADPHLEVDSLRTASDGSEAAGAVIYGNAFSDRGRALPEGRQRPADAACEEVTALVSGFGGIVGGCRASE